MTNPGGPYSHNAAGGNAHGFTQAQNIYGDSSVFDLSDTVVHGDIHFDVPPGATAAAKYRAGVEHLKSGMAPEARKLIWEAMMEGHRTSEACFYWLVAMLSGRTIGQFAELEITQLKKMEERRSNIPGDPWEDGSRLVFKLLASAGVLERVPKPDVTLVIEEFDGLGVEQRDMLLPHLDLFVEGSLKDDVWSRERANAEDRQLEPSRHARAWMFFQPDPGKPYIRLPQPVATTRRDWQLAWACVVLLAVVAGFLGWELIWQVAWVGLLAYVLALAGGAAALISEREGQFQAWRRRSLEVRLMAPDSAESPLRRNWRPAKVDVLFNKYASRYVRAEEREAWKADTAGARRFDRNEIVEGCQALGHSVDEMAWLVRYRVRQSRDMWRKGELRAQLALLYPKHGAALASRAGLAVAVVGSVGAVVELRHHSLGVIASVIFVGLPSAFGGWRCWLGIDLERRRYAAEKVEAERRSEDTRREFERWKKRLEARPTDAEMATWLDYDRTVLLGRAMDRYKLARHQVVEHAFLEERGEDAKRARGRNGPMRYSRYRLIVFLLTSDGVRQTWADLQFLHGKIIEGNRLSYRYDAVVSAHVQLIPGASQQSRRQQKFTLTLANGDPFDVMITDFDPEDLQPGEDELSLDRAAFEAASVTNTLHVLEGIAAEGRRWFESRKARYRWAAG